MTRLVAVLACVVFFAWSIGRAVDHEFQGRAGAAPTAPGNTETLYQGKPILWWAKRTVQARKDANARGRTIKRLRRELHSAGPSWAWLAAADCIYRNENGGYGWGANTGNGYYGGMQADLSFQRAYGHEYLIRWGTANNWPWWAQLHMAWRGWAVRGWQPWPNTSRECGLR